MLEPFGGAGSINVRKVLRLGDEPGLAFVHHGGGAPLDRAGLLALDPDGPVTVIRDDGCRGSPTRSAATSPRARAAPTCSRPGPHRAVDGLAGHRAQRLALRLHGHGAARPHPCRCGRAASVQAWNRAMGILDRRSASPAGRMRSAGPSPWPTSCSACRCTAGFPRRSNGRCCPPYPTDYYAPLGGRPAFLRHGRNGPALTRGRRAMRVRQSPSSTILPRVWPASSWA